MTRLWALLALAVVAACAADDAMEMEVDGDTDASLDEETAEAHDDAPPELASQDDPALIPKCTYVISCSRDAQDLQPVLVCDQPPLEPVDPWDPTDGDWPPFEPWTPLEVEPDVDRIAADADPVADIPWPPPGCHEELVLVDVVHAVACRNQCLNPTLEECTDQTTGEWWVHNKYHRPDEFYGCYYADWEECGVASCEPT